MGKDQAAENTLQHIGISGTIQKCCNCQQESDSFVSAACSHVFCLQCYRKLFTELEAGAQPLCPEDGQIIVFGYDVINATGGEKQLVPKMRMPCANKARGCKKMVFFHDMDDHLNSCVYRLLPSCPQGCSEKVIFKDLVNHLTSVCNCRLVKCQFCHDDVSLKMIENHEFQCPEKLVACPYCNTGQILQKKLHRHIEYCPMSPDLCIMREMGCMSEGTKKDIQLHQQNWSCHIEVLVKYISSLQGQINDISSRVDDFQQNSVPLTQTQLPASGKKQKKDNSTVCCVDGIYLWQIKSVSEMITTNQDFMSPKFYAFEQGYHMHLQLRIGSDVTLRISVEDGANDASLSWPFAEKMKVMILDQYSGTHCSIEVDAKENTENFSLQESKTGKWAGLISNVIEPELLLCKEGRFIRNDSMVIKFMVLK